ncbi:MAG: hypothetical protein WD768_09615 [Phycisphaeraceae bacterium]
MSISSSPRPGFHLPSWLWAPYALYAVSAACILVGISQIILPIYAKPDDPPMLELLYALGALNLYEVAVIGVALVLVLWLKVVDDVIALTLIIGIFLIASTIALDQVASYFPAQAILFGVAGLILAALKLGAIHRYVTGRFERLLLVGLLGLLAWNALMPGLLGQLLASNQTHLDLITPWRLGFAVSLAAGVIMLFAAMRLHEGSATCEDDPRPFLRRPAMRWILAGIILLGTITHQYAITWAFNIPISWQELIPMSGLVALLVLELRRAYGRRQVVTDSLLALAPLALALGVAIGSRLAPSAPSTINTLADPSLFLVVIAMFLVVHGWRRGMDIMFIHAGLYGMAATLLIGFDPQLPFTDKWHLLQWNACAFALSGTLAVLSAWYRSPTFAWSAALAFAGSIATSDAGFALIEAYTLNRVAVILLLLGCFTLIAACIFRRTFSRAIALLAAMALVAGVIHCFFPSLQPRGAGLRVSMLDYPLAAGLITLGYIALVSGWTHHYRLLVPGSIPLALAMITQRHHGWVWIAMSFIVLALGAVASVRKSLAKSEPGAMEVTGEVS